MMKIYLFACLAAIVFTGSVNAQNLQRIIDFSDPNYNFAEVADMETERVTNVPHALLNFQGIDYVPYAMLLRMNQATGIPNQNFNFFVNTKGYKNINAVAFERRLNYFYVTGTIQSKFSLDRKMFVMKVEDGTGAIIWSRFLGTAPSDQTVADIDVDTHGTTIWVLGDEEISGNRQLFVAIIDAGTGNLNTYRNIGNSSDEETAYNIRYSSANELYISAVRSPSSNSLDRKGLVLRIDASGSVLNASLLKFMNSSGTYQHRIYRMYVQKYAGNVYIIAQAVVGPSDPGPFIILKANTTLGLLGYKTHALGRIQIESVEIKYDQILLGGMAPIGSGEYGFINALYDLNGDFIAAGNYNTIPINSIAGSSETVFVSSTEMLMLTESSAMGSEIYEVRADAQARTYCLDQNYIINPVEEIAKFDQHLIDVTAPTHELSNIAVQQPAVDLVNTLLCETGPAMKHSNQEKHTLNDSNTNGSNGIACYPNPTKEELIVVSNGIEIAQIKVYSYTGKTVKQIQVDGEVSASLNMSDFPEGIYLIEVHAQSGEVFYERVVKE